MVKSSVMLMCGVSEEPVTLGVAMAAARLEFVLICNELVILLDAARFLLRPTLLPRRGLRADGANWCWIVELWFYGDSIWE